MKVYVYDKKNGRKRVETLTDVQYIRTTINTFELVTNNGAVFSYDKNNFMVSAFGY